MSWLTARSLNPEGISAAAFPTHRHERHQTRLRARIAPAMPCAVLDDAVPLPQVHLLPVVELQRHLATHHDTIVDRVRRVHAGCGLVEVLGHAGHLVIELFHARFVGHAGRWLVALRALAGIGDQPEVGAARSGEGPRLAQHWIGLDACELGHALGGIELVEGQPGVGIDVDDLRGHVEGPEYRLASRVSPRKRAPRWRQRRRGVRRLRRGAGSDGTGSGHDRKDTQGAPPFGVHGLLRWMLVLLRHGVPFPWMTAVDETGFRETYD